MLLLIITLLLTPAVETLQHVGRFLSSNTVLMFQLIRFWSRWSRAGSPSLRVKKIVFRFIPAVTDGARL